jgi:hypothetical protein
MTHKKKRIKTSEIILFRPSAGYMVNNTTKKLAENLIPNMSSKLTGNTGWPKEVGEPCLILESQQIIWASL